MDEMQVALKSAGPAGSADLRPQVVLTTGVLIARWFDFMLRTPRPLVVDVEDIAAAKAALAESDERIPYEQIRRELGLQ
jgi:hypothetical protein